MAFPKRHVGNNELYSIERQKYNIIPDCGTFNEESYLQDINSVKWRALQWIYVWPAYVTDVIIDLLESVATKRASIRRMSCNCTNSAVIPKGGGGWLFHNDIILQIPSIKKKDFLTKSHKYPFSGGKQLYLAKSLFQMTFINFDSYIPKRVINKN